MLIRVVYQVCLSTLLVSPLAAQTPPSFRGLAQAGGSVWVSGSHASVRRSPKAGKPFVDCAAPSGAEALDFRGIYAWTPAHALVMSSGPGSQSRLFETTDACQSWSLVAKNTEPTGFWDALTFSQSNPSMGVLLGDPVAGRFTILRTNDGGKHWLPDDDPGLASSPAGEGAFAASNSSLVIIAGSGNLIFGTGGLGGARIFRFDAHRRKWSVTALPTHGKGEAAGIFALHFRDGQHGVAMGGDYKLPQNTIDTAFVTADGGVTWRPAIQPPRGYRSAVDWTAADKCWVAAGPTGSDRSTDDGLTWQPVDNGKWNVLNLPWAAGPGGQIERLNLQPR